jgi:hypothetical protein
METLQELILTGRIVDIMLVFIILEILVVLVIRNYRGGAVPPLPLLVNIGAGGSLMLALRVALTGSAWPLLAACLVSALIFHVLDLYLRWQAPVPSSQDH